MRRIGLCLVAFALLALPVLAQSPPVPACSGLKGSFPLDSLAGTSYKPLQPEERLFYGLAGLEQGSPLEVRYLVGGKPYLTEAVDLAASRLPEDPTEKPKLKSRTALDLEGERMIELLALRPGLVRELHQLSRDNDIQVEFHQGRLVESLSLEELRQRGAELGKRQAMPLVVRSTVNGGKDRGEDKMRSVVAFDYLPDCGDCTAEMPCETECGYDPGKGGPVTCGEQGQPCQSNSTCACSTVFQEFWTAWYVYNSYYSNYYECLEKTNENSSWHRFFVRQTRRDRIRRTFVCPSCPSCNGCYTQEDVIDYQLGSGGCWDDTYSTCFWGDPACCGSTCYFGSCYWGC